MKKQTFELTSENFNEAIELLYNNDQTYDLQKLSSDVCSVWNGLVVEGLDTLEDTVNNLGWSFNLPEDFDFKRHQKAFEEACGFGGGRTPKNFPWGGTGDVQWLTRFDEADLEKWCLEKHAEAALEDELEDEIIENTKAYEAELEADREAYESMTQEERDAHDNL